jgi:hypothetical protein
MPLLSRILSVNQRAYTKEVLNVFSICGYILCKTCKKRVRKKFNILISKLPNSREITFSKEDILKKPLGSKIGNTIEHQQASEAIHERIFSF